MGFWRSVGKVTLSVATWAFDETKSAVDRGERYKDEMLEKSDDELKKIIIKYKHSLLMVSAAFQELKGRGYTKEDLVEVYKQ